MIKNKPMIGIVIVTYNNLKDIDTCLSSVFKSTYKNLKVFLVDNHSADQTAAFVKQKYPGVATFALQKNTGFAAGNNYGIKQAIGRGCEFIFLLNPDTMIDKNCLKILSQKADDQTILQPLVLIHDGQKKTHLVNTTGGVLNFLGFSYCGDYRKNKNSVRKNQNVVVASGAAMLVPAAVFKKTGFFDENFFMYHEDVDLSWRARLSGFDIRLVPSALVWHKYSFSKSQQKLYHFEKNRLLFLLRNFSTKYLILIFPAFVINEVLMLIYALISGWFLLKIKSYFSILKLFSSEIKFRHKNLKKFQKNEKKLKKYLQSEISFSEIQSPLFKPYNFVLRLYWQIIALMI